MEDDSIEDLEANLLAAAAKDTDESEGEAPKDMDFAPLSSRVIVNDELESCSSITYFSCPTLTL